MKTSGANSQKVLSALKQWGLLLETDSRLPSVAGLVAQESFRGSWWTHPRAQEIFALLQQLVDHKAVLVTKLISGKVTFVHRRLWPEVISIGLAREAWQVSGLSPAAQMLLAKTDQEGSISTNELQWPENFGLAKPGEIVRELEKRLLVHSEEIHTDSGAHAKSIETWASWIKNSDIKPRRIAVQDARLRLEQRVASLNDHFGASATLPWRRRV